MSEDLSPETPVETAADAAPAEAPRETLEDILSRTYDTIEARTPSRDDGGRFASKNPEAAPDKATPAAVTDQPAPKEGEPQPAAIAPPDSWSAEHKAKFATLPPDVQAYIAQREGEAHKAITQKGAEAARWEPLTRALEPHRQRMQAVGVSEPEFLSRLLNAERALSDPQTRPQAFRWLAEQYGFDVGQLGNTHAAQPGAPVDPALAAAMAKIAHLERWAETREQAERRAADERRAQADREAESKAQAFLNDPKFPHAKDLEGDIAALILASRQVGKEITLEQAYAKATRSNEAIWAKLEAERIASEKKKGDEAAAKAAAEARRRAPTTAKPRGSTARAPAKSGDWETRMSEVYDSLNPAA